MNRKNRKGIAENTLAILEKGYYLNSKKEKDDFSEIQKTALENTQLYRPKELLELIENQVLNPREKTSVFEVINSTTMDAVRDALVEDSNVLCLNFASAKNPGGGFLGGSQAQEETIARASGLYPCLKSAWEYYEVNRSFSSSLYTDHIIYTPKVPVFKNEDGDLLDELIYASFITAPAVNAGAVRKNENNNIKKIETVQKRRMDMLLAIAKEKQHETLILGAWGCGVFQNDPAVIAEMFRELLDGKYENQFKKVIFAVYANNPRFIEPFEYRF